MFGISFPSLVTHQQKPVEPWHCMGSYEPSARHFGMNCPTSGGPLVASKYSFWHLVTPVRKYNFVLVMMDGCTRLHSQQQQSDFEVISNMRDHVLLLSEHEVKQHDSQQGNFGVFENVVKHSPSV